MSNLIYSLNATMPIFFVIIVGYACKRYGMLTEDFVNCANKFNFNVTLPALLVRDMMNSGIKDNFNVKFILFCAIATTISIVVVWALAKPFFKNNKSCRAEFVQGAYRSSAAILAIALLTNLTGSAGMGAIMIAASVPIYNLFAVIILTVEKDESEQVSARKLFFAVCKNPMIISILIGLIFAFMEVEFPKMIATTVDYIARLATPMALIIIGAGFKGAKALTMVKPTVVATLIKLCGFVIVFLPIAIKLGFRGEELIVITMMLGSPATASCYTMAKSMGHEGTLSSSIVMLTTVLSAFTMTLIVFILKSMGLI
ncbi:MAG: AEC family transporter [Lachnospiraceae bacterium]|nr:AEC family transporter [Lachnospiraceae bacterium]